MPSPSQAPADPSQAASTDREPWHMAEHWPEMVTAITDQSIETVSLLQRGLDLLLSKGRITPAEHQVLALPAEKLKHCGISAQQIIRFQSGRVRQSHEKIDLAYLVECVLHERRNALALLGVSLRRKFIPVNVLIDPTLGFTLTQSMIDWSLPFGDHIDVRLDVTGAPTTARLSVKTYNDHAPTQSAVFENGIHWLLLRQIAATDGAIDLERTLTPEGVVLTATFRRTLATTIPELVQSASLETKDSLFHSISGSYALVLSSQPELRLQALEIIRKLGVTVDGVADTSQALDALREQPAQLLVLDRSVDLAHAEPFLQTLQRQYPGTAVIEIAPAGARLPAQPPHPTILRNALQAELGPTAMFTLSRQS